MVTRRSLTIIINIRTTKHDANDQRLLRVPEPRPQRCRPRSARWLFLTCFRVHRRAKSTERREKREKREKEEAGTREVARKRAFDGMPRTTGHHRSTRETNRPSPRGREGKSLETLWILSLLRVETPWDVAARVDFVGKVEGRLHDRMSIKIHPFQSK